MKNLKRLVAITVLVLTLGVAAYAGDMDTPGYVPPPPPPPTPVAAPAPGDLVPGQTTTAAGDIDSPSLAAIVLETVLGVVALY